MSSIERSIDEFGVAVGEGEGDGDGDVFGVAVGDGVGDVTILLVGDGTSEGVVVGRGVWLTIPTSLVLSVDMKEEYAEYAKAIHTNVRRTPPTIAKRNKGFFFGLLVDVIFKDSIESLCCSLRVKNSGTESCGGGGVCVFAFSTFGKLSISI